MVTDRPRGLLISPAPKGHHEIAQGKAKRRPGCVPAFFPTVAWPSEAVRVGDDSIAFIQKLVADPFYRPRGDPFPCVPCVPWFKEEKPAMTKNRG
jgi:hypothetical protein